MLNVYSEKDNKINTKDNIDSDYCSDTESYNKYEYDSLYIKIRDDYPNEFTFSKMSLRFNNTYKEGYISYNIMDHSIGHLNKFSIQQFNRIRQILAHSPFVPSASSNSSRTKGSSNICNGRIYPVVRR